MQLKVEITDFDNLIPDDGQIHPSVTDDTISVFTGFKTDPSWLQYEDNLKLYFRVLAQEAIERHMYVLLRDKYGFKYPSTVLFLIRLVRENYKPDLTEDQMFLNAAKNEAALMKAFQLTDIVSAKEILLGQNAEAISAEQCT